MTFTTGLLRTRRTFQFSSFLFMWLISLLIATSSLAQTATAAPEPASAPVTTQTESYGALADLLENEKTRDQLIEQLRSLATQPDASQATTTDSAASRDAQPGARATEQRSVQEALGEGIAARMQFFAEQLKDDMAGSWRVVSALLSGEAAPGVSLQRWLPALYSLALTVIAVSIAYAVLRIGANVGFARINTWITKESHPAPRPHKSQTARRHTSLRHITTFTKGRKLLGVLLALALDLAASLLAALAGYLAVIVLTQQGASVSLFSMQFLTAFVMIEAVKAISRGVFATRHEHLRLLPVTAEAAQYWNRWLVIIITITGYSLLVVVPIVQTLLTPAVGDLLGLLLMIAVYLYAVSVVWGKRHTVRAGLNDYAERTTTAVFGTLIRVVARIWHWLILVYLTILFVVSQTRQKEALSFMGKATAQSLIAILIGAALATVISTLATRRVTLPDQWNRVLPSLESRLNAYIPAILKGLRFLILILVTLVVLDAWQAFNLVAWLSSSSGQAVVSTVIHVGIILLIAIMSWTVLASVIEHRLGTSTGRSIPTEREKTLLMLFRNAAAITIVTMTVLVVLSQIGIDIGPLIAGAGVAGLAIGFGAQKLVQDVITGVFIQLENGMNQNDIVELADLFGTVEKITIRSVVIRTLDGGYHLVPFSTIDKLTNHTRDYGYHYAEYSIAHRENADDAIAQLHLAFKELMQDPDMAAEVLEDITIPGVTSINQFGFTIRVMIKTTPGNQWAIQRAYNRLVKQHFDAAGIEVPYPQTVLHFGRDKNGQAAPVDVRHITKLEESFNPESAPGQTLRTVAESEAATDEHVNDAVAQEQRAADTAKLADVDEGDAAKSATKSTDTKGDKGSDTSGDPNPGTPEPLR